MASSGTAVKTQKKAFDMILNWFRPQFKTDYRDLCKHRIPTLKNTNLVNTTKFKSITLEYIFKAIEGEQQ